MSGHSKWANIKHRKAAADAKKAGVFAKLTKAIAVAASQGGGDPETNYTLRTALERAKQLNLPKDRIDRAIKKGTGELREGARLESLILEAYGPGGAAILIKIITDNRNRATAEIRHILEKHNGKLAAPGSAKWAFAEVEREKGNIEWEPKTTLDLGENDKKALGKLYEALDEQEDVQEIYSNGKSE